MSQILDIRHHFDLPPDHAYLNTAYMGPMPRSAVEAGTAALRAKSQPWTVPVHDFFEPVGRVRRSVAGLLDGDPAGVALVPSVSYGIALQRISRSAEARRSCCWPISSRPTCMPGAGSPPPTMPT
jgi:hypothetical protein